MYLYAFRNLIFFLFIYYVVNFDNEWQRSHSKPWAFSHKSWTYNIYTLTIRILCVKEYWMKMYLWLLKHKKKNISELSNVFVPGFTSLLRQSDSYCSYSCWAKSGTLRAIKNDHVCFCLRLNKKLVHRHESPHLFSASHFPRMLYHTRPLFWCPNDLSSESSVQRPILWPSCFQKVSSLPTSTKSYICAGLFWF